MKKIVITISLTLVLAQSIIAQTQDQDLNMATYQLQFLSASGGSNRIQGFGGSSPGTWLFKSRFDNIVFEAGENDNNKRQIIFKIGDTEKLRINTHGHLGIGINPEYKLHVGGDAKIEGTLGDTYLGTNQLQFLSASGGNNRIHSFGGSTPGTWLFKSRFDDIVFEAGENDNNRRQIIFKTGDTEKARLTKEGAFRIGTTSNGSHLLAVGGSIGAREIKVEAGTWSDFVFENDYALRTLEEVEEHINENGHLPEIPSEAEVSENGINLGEMDAKLLQKIEELTLYMININKRVNQLETENSELKESNQQLENEVSALKND